uniref:Uncharacterized protein n=1 Tax=Arundo donax TaxID=35708 RepID=A0A0A9HIH1_ARUDO
MRLLACIQTLHSGLLMKPPSFRYY